MLRITTERMQGLAKTPVSLRVRRRQVREGAAAALASLPDSSDSSEAEDGGAAPAAPTSLAIAFLESCKEAAARFGLDADAVRYCGVLALFDRLVRATGMELVPKGDLAMSIGIYALLAHRILDEVEAQGELPSAEDLAALLDRELPSDDATSVSLGEVRVSRTAARCAIPFSLGVSEMVSEHDVEFLCRAVSSGNIKAARYALNFILREAAEDDREEAEEEGRKAEEEGGDAAELAPKPCRYMVPRVTEEQAYDIITSLPEKHTAGLLRSFGRKRDVSEPEYIDKVTRGRAALPPYASHL
jgi:hypothetical protein